MEINNVQISKFNQMCRTCLNEGHFLTSLYDETDQNDSLIIKLKMCTSIQCNKNDGLPDKICPKCIDELFQSYNFAKKCKLNDTSLKQYLKKQNDIHVETSIENELSYINHNNTEEAKCVIKNEYVDNSVYNEVINNIDTALTSEIIIKEEIEVVDLTTEEEQQQNYINNEWDQYSVEINESTVATSPTDHSLQNQYIKVEYNDFDMNKKKTNQTQSKHKRKHQKDRLFKCDICSKAYRIFSKLKVHKRIHTGERPYKCDICEKAFICTNDLNKHKMIHSGERPFKCDICKKTFQFLNVLNNHKIIHTGERPYKCETCLKAFNRADYLIQHRKIHTGERPYKCKICDKTFSCSSYLMRHTKIHNGLRPYVCNICLHTFSCSSNLLLHVKKNRCK